MPPSWASKTLRLPRSSLPPRAVPADRPKYIQRVTEELNAWQKVNGTGRFVLHDGPPYANGDLHIGHALNKILKDITCRYQVSQGRRVEFRPGWDCHGLPIELKALQKQKELGNLQHGQSLGPVETRQVARELASKTVELQKARFREWAVMADWDNPWRTMDKDYEIRQLEIFKLMVGNGQIYRRLKPVYWSPSSRTALAEAELEYNSDHRSTAAYVKFQLSKIPQAVRDILPDTNSTVAMAIWTTTPWTLPANRAVAVGRDMEYLVLQSESHGIVIVAASRLADLETISPGNTVLGKITGLDLEGSAYIPLFGVGADTRPILHADYVTDDSGTGIVHMAPGHGMDDYKLCQTHGIEPFAPLDDTGCFTAEAFPGTNELEGKSVLTSGNQAVLTNLQNRNSLIATHQYRHKYPYDWRSKQPVIIRATEQWFADLSGIREKALQSLGNVKFIPSGGYERLSSFIKGRSEWCISRQRAWGVPIPALYDCNGKAALTVESISHIISTIQQRGIDSWWSDEPTDPTWVPPSLHDQGPFTRGRDTMDVWFDSGTSWSEMSTESSADATPVADVFLEGTDQHRGWFQSSLLTKVAQLTALKQDSAQAPFKTLITHGFTLDHRGKKMSKSEGNVISPAEIMDGTLLPPLKRKGSKTTDNQGPTYDGMGPDALRLWVASSDFTSDLVVGAPALKAINGALSKLRVTFKLLTGLLDTYDLSYKVDFSNLRTLDRLAVLHVQMLKSEVDKAYQEYAYHRVVSAINTYVNADLSAFYIESIKDRCYVDATSSRSRMDAQCVLWQVYQTLSQVLLPITPLIVAEARDHLPEQLQIYDAFKLSGIEKYSTIQNISQDEKLEKLFNTSQPCNIRTIWDGIKTLQETARAEKLMGSSLDSYVAIRFPAESSNQALNSLRIEVEQMRSELEDLFVVSRVSILSSEQEVEAINCARWVKQTTQSIPSNSQETDNRIEIYVYAPHQAKCVRCWKYTVHAEASTALEEALEEPLCQRCLGVLEGQKDDQPDLFEGRPNIAKAAAACREVKTGDLVEWNWNLKQSS